MKCPKCDSENLKVVDKRASVDGTNRRRRECDDCGARFTTYEAIEQEESNSITQVKKRDGTIALFDQKRITDAVFNAAKAVGGHDRSKSQEVSDGVVKFLNENFKGKIPTVENIQDLVEKVLIEQGHAKVAKAYILYRSAHEKIRQKDAVFLEIGKTMDEYLGRADWRVKENSNAGFSVGGLILYASGKMTANYWLNHVYPSEVKDAHSNGDIHIHDLSMFTGYSFYRNETIVVRDKITKKLLVLSLEQLFNLVNSRIIEENGFEIKYNNDYEVLDENGWTDLKRVLRHKTDKPLMSFNTFNGHNVITTSDHPFITLKQEKNLVSCTNCESLSIVKNRTNKIGKDYYKCKDCCSTFGLPVENVPDLNKRKVVYADNIKLKNYSLIPDYDLDVSIVKNNLNSSDGWFIGMFVSEGYFNKNYLSFELKKDTLEFRKLLQYLEFRGIEYNICSRQLNLNGGEVLILESVNPMVVIDIKIKSIPIVLQSCIVSIRQYSENKNLPIDFINFKPEVIGSMVSGVIDGDGVVRNDDKWVSRANIRLTSKTLLSQIQFWLKNQKINSSLLTIDGYGDREYKGVKIRPRKQLYSLTIFIPKKKSNLFKECLKINNNFKYSNVDYKFKKYSNFRKIENIKNDSDYVYDVTTSSHSFLCNGILVHNCAGWSLKQLLEEGFGGVPGQLRTVPPKHFDTVVGQVVNFLGTMQNEWAGAQALSSFDTYLAPFVRTDNMTYKQVKQKMQTLLFHLATPSRWGTQTPFLNFTFDWVVPEDLKNEKVIVGGKRLDFTYNECQEEMDLINKAFIECMIEGDASGRIFTFPIPTYNITRDFNWDSENANLLFEMTAKYGIPYFQNFVNSDLKPTDVRSMCCRLRLDLRELRKKTGGLFGSGENTGSIGVVTINLPRIGYLSKTKEEFLERLNDLMEIGKTSLEVKREVIDKQLESGLLPYTKRYLGSLDNHFSTIGLNGMNEACLNFLNKNIATEEGKNFAEEVLVFMRDKLSDFQEKTGHIYNLEATPAEGTSYRFAKMDVERYPNIITAGSEEPFYTNSSLLPVGYTDDIFEVLDHQDSLQTKYTGGTVVHSFLGERIEDAETCKKLVKKIAYSYRLPYFTISPTFSVCMDHGYIKGEVPQCPDCGKDTEVYSRVVGYIRPLNYWNKGKREEWNHRKVYSPKHFEKDIEPHVLVKPLVTN